LMTWGDEVALFEEGTFVPEMGAALIERLLKQPSRFELARFKIEGAREETLRRLGVLLPELGEGARPLEVVRALCRRAAQLPPYPRLTKRLSEQARAVRDALLHARDPLRLLFVDLPQAVGLDGISTSNEREKAVQLSKRLGGCLAEVADAYPRLLREI